MTKELTLKDIEAAKNAFVRAFKSVMDAFIGVGRLIYRPNSPQMPLNRRLHNAVTGVKGVDIFAKQNACAPNIPFLAPKWRHPMSDGTARDSRLLSSYEGTGLSEETDRRILAEQDRMAPAPVAGFPLWAGVEPPAPTPHGGRNCRCTFTPCVNFDAQKP